MKASKDTISSRDILICEIDVFGDGHVGSYDGHINFITADGVDVKYLQGHSSRDDFVPWANIKAKVDKSQPRVHVGGFEGHFQVFEEQPND